MPTADLAHLLAGHYTDGHALLCYLVPGKGPAPEANAQLAL